MTEADWLSVMSGERRGAAAGALRVALAAAEPGYAAAMRARNALFDRGIKRGVRLPHPTISVGNLTTGGTGKTPVVREVVRRLEAMGRRPAVLLRGYRKDAAGESDELAEYRELGVRAVANPNRVAGATAALAQWPATDAFVLDDGFQHRRVERDLDLVLIDATRPWGYGHVLPRGLLREPRAGLRRASAVVVTRADCVSSDELAEIDATIARFHGRPSIAHIRHVWTRWHGIDAETIRGARVFAVAGIGNPEPFFAAVRREVREVVDTLSFPDHHEYTLDDLRTLMYYLREMRVDAAVTTMKDWVKIKSRWPRTPPPRFAVPEVGIAFLDGEEAFEQLIRHRADRVASLL